jgi:hypothetical protein
MNRPAAHVLFARRRRRIVVLVLIHHSISEAWAQFRTGHPDIRNYYTDRTEAERTTNVTLATATPPITITDRIGPRPPAIRQRLHQAKTQPSPTSTDIHWSRHHGIRSYLSHTAAAEPSVNATHAATEESTTATISTISRLRALRNQLQQARTS